MTSHPRMSRTVLAVAARISIVAGLIVALFGSTILPASAAPSNNRAHHGYGDVTTNGFGGTDSWGGSFGLWTGQNQTGEFIPAYCIERGTPYPQGTDPNFADANSGFSLVGDTPAARGVDEATRQALSYALSRYGGSTDDITAGAMFLLTHLMSADPSFGSTTVENTVLGGDWPNAAAVHARAIEIRDRSFANRGPWTMNVDIIENGSDRTGEVSLTGPGGPIVGEGVIINATNAAGVPALSLTDATGKVTFTMTPLDVNESMSIVAQSAAPGYYRVFQGAAGTQQVIASSASTPLTGFDSALPPTGNARVTKETDNPDYQNGDGATFEIRYGDVNGAAQGTMTVDASGMSNTISGLAPGTYAIVETAAPEGQQLDPTPHTVTVTAGDTVTFDHTNTVLREGNLEFFKRDRDTDAVLPGAFFDVRYDSNNDGTYDTPVGNGPDGTPGTADDGRYETAIDAVTITDLAAGNYQVTEVVPPPGYTLPAIGERSETVTFTYGDHSTPDDNVLDAIVTLTDRQANIITQVVRPAVPDDPATNDVDETEPERADNVMTVGTPIADRVILSNVASDIAGTVTATLYGPYPTADDIDCSAETLVGTETFETLGSGTYTSPTFTPTEPGIYTFVESFEGSDGSTADHACGLTAETLSMPTIATQVSDTDITFGASLIDTATVTGVNDGVTGTIDATLYGPFESVDDIVCDTTTAVETVTFEAVGSGSFPSPEITPPSAGIFTFVETWTETLAEPDDPNETADEPVTVSHECGLVTETATVTPGLATQVTQTEIETGGAIADTSILTGVPAGYEGTATFTLYGPFETVDDIVCDDTSTVTSVYAATSGSGSVMSPTITVDAAGVYTFVETWESSSGELTATHECGLTSETFTVRNPPGTTEPPTLAKTGNETGPVSVVGMSLIALGFSFVGVDTVVRRRRDQPTAGLTGLGAYNDFVFRFDR